MHEPHERVEERLANQTWGALSSQGCVMGLDVGSYGLRAALVDLHQNTYTSVQRDVDSTEPENMVEAIINLGRSLLDEKHVADAQIVRIGVGFGGPVDARRGVVIRSPRVAGWEQFPLAERIEASFGASALVDNDANLIALAEATFGTGVEVKDVFYLHLSSGVGGGLVLNGKLYHGASAMAGEIGHAVVGSIDAIQPERTRMTLEELVSIRGLLSRSAELGFKTDLLSDIFSNQPVGKQVVSEVVDLLAMRLSQIAALIDPALIVLGGVVARSGGDPFISAIQQRMDDYMNWQVQRPLPIVASVLGFESVAIGGVALALESLAE